MSWGPVQYGLVQQSPSLSERISAASNYVNALHDNYSKVGEASYMPPTPSAYDNPRRGDPFARSVSNYKSDTLNAALVDYVVINGQRCARVNL
jgi:hypothetical protein